MANCAARKLHIPTPQTEEDHHVIPQAWQRADGGLTLWAPETVTLCPTCHRNVHYWIVKLMKALHAAYSNDPRVARRAVFGNRRLTTEQRLAQDALLKYRASGKSLLFLCEKHNYGYAGKNPFLP